LIKEARFQKVKLSSKLKNFITPLSKEEQELLEQSIIAEGAGKHW